LIGNVVKFFKCPKFHDERGWFEVGYNQKYFAEEIADVNFVQQNISYSYKNVARGLHFQYINPQAKLVSCIEGEVIDYVMDLRLGSNTFGKYMMYLLDDPDTFLYVPIGFAHGFIVKSQTAIFQYKCDNLYAPQAEGAIAWNDPTIGIDWGIPEQDILLSEKDKHHNSLTEADYLFDYNVNLY
jgi:dTDP-4-dehydrorhamnose 3,5-epimerase